MTLNAIRLISAVFTAVAMAGGFAHLLELPNKMKLSREDYLTVQQICRSPSFRIPPRRFTADLS